MKTDSGRLIAGNRKRGNFDVGTYCIQKYEFEISEANLLRVARRGEAESEFFLNVPYSVYANSALPRTTCVRRGQKSEKTDLSKKLPEVSLGYILRNRPTGMLLRPY